MAKHANLGMAAVFGAMFSIIGAGAGHAQQAIGSAAAAQNQVTRELAGAQSALAVGDSVYRNEVVRTGSDSLAKLVFLDSTNLAVGPTSRVTLDEFVYAGEISGQKMTVNLAKGIFRFTTGALDKKAYTITTPTAAIGVRGTVLDIDARGAGTRVTLVEGRALVCPRRAGVTLEQQARACGAAFGGAANGRGSGRCECEEITNPGQTAQVKRGGGASLTSTPVNFASLCSGDICTDTSYASNNTGGGGGGVLCGR